MNRLSTAFYEAVTPVVAGKIPSRSRLVATRYYYGDGTVCRSDSVVMTRFGGGYFDASGRAHYELADYQGNITTVIDSDGNIVSHTGFYPYGQPWRRPGERQWLYGGKEWLGADGRDEYDFHARRQYPHLAMFTTPDPKSESFYNCSPYIYCNGDPINAIDKDGKLTIFINGMHFGDGGSEEYWNGVDKLVMRLNKDYHALYIDGSLNGKNGLPDNLSADMRYKAGKQYGEKYIKTIISSLDSKEFIRIITHSMGAAFAKGFIDALYHYLYTLPLLERVQIQNRLKVEIDLAPFQPKEQSASCIPTYVFQKKFDWLANTGKMEGAIYDPRYTEDIDAKAFNKGYETMKIFFLIYCVIRQHGIVNFYSTIEEYYRDHPESKEE